MESRVELGSELSEQDLELDEYELELIGEKQGPTANRLFRNLVEHATYDMALLFTAEQCILYHRSGRELHERGVSMDALRTAFVQQPIDSGWLPKQTLRWGSGSNGTFLVQFVPPTHHTLQLSAQSQTVPRALSLPLPGLIFAGVGMIYYVWAVQGNGIGPKTLLFRAPFPNVYPDGRICFGSNTPPEVTRGTIEEAWRLFINSPFGSDFVNEKSICFPQDVRRQLLSLTEKTHYPVEDLVVQKKQGMYMSDARPPLTIEDAVKKFLLKEEM